MIFFDGGVKGEFGGSGWIIEASSEPSLRSVLGDAGRSFSVGVDASLCSSNLCSVDRFMFSDRIPWCIIGRGGVFHMQSTTIDAEIIGMSETLNALLCIIVQQTVQAECCTMVNAPMFISPGSPHVNYVKQLCECDTH